jgi:hypothetical protein
VSPDIDDVMDWMSDSFLRFLVGIAIGLVVLFAAIGVPLRMADRHMAGNQCSGYEHRSGFVTEMADYSFLSYDCLAQMDDGRWIPVDQIRKVGE